MSTARRSHNGLVVVAYGYAASERDAVAKVVQDLAAELRRRGERVAVIGIPQERIVLSGGNAVAKVRRLWSELRFLGSAARFIWAHRRATRVVITVDVPSGIPFIGALARRLGRGRVTDVAWVMDLYRLASDQGGPTSRARAALERAALRASGKVVTIGDCMADALSEVTGSNVSTIPLWHRNVSTTPVGDRGGPLRLLYSGSARDIHPLLPLVKAVANRGDVELAINGSGTEVDRVAAYLAGNPVRNVRIGGFVTESELEGAYAAADIHVVSLAESATGTCVPSKVYAAMAAGRGVLYLGSVSGQAARDVLAANAGVVAPSASISAISTIVSKLVSDHDAIQEYGAQARRFFEEQRTVRAGGKKWAVAIAGTEADTAMSASAS
jgi:glycosyltransferase involved in cell wall biosynthesis